MKFLVVMLLGIGLAGCSTLTRSDEFQDDQDDGQQVTHEEPMISPGVEVINGADEEELAQKLPAKVQTIQVNLDPKEKGVPKVVNDGVKKWLHYFQNRGRRHMVKFLQRSGRYVPAMKEILRQYGLPEELVYISMIESGFSARATSHASAVGYWQFLRGTAKDFGLRVNGYVDERRDPILATNAAAKYLKGVYNVFGSWNLAIASYNAGHNRLKGVVMRTHIRDYWELCRLKKLPRETREYVPKFIAAWMIGENPELYGFKDIDYQPRFSADEIRLKNSISMSKMASNIGVSVAELKKLNPAVPSDYVRHGKYGVRGFRVPKGKGSIASQKVYASTSYRRPSVSTAGNYRVKRGDTLSGLAERYGTSVSKLRRANNLSRRSYIKIGQRLKIPGMEVASSASSELKSSGRISHSGVHTVQRGDNLIAIANKYKVSVSALQSINDIRRGSFIIVGQKLKIPGDQRSVAQASSHTVQRGENLIEIAKKYGVSLSALQSENNIRRGGFIMVGQKLSIPSGKKSVHVVQRGETLSEIAVRYGVSLSQLRSLNSIGRRATIFVGSRLRIPN